jgi:hypothetical protein
MKTTFCDICQSIIKPRSKKYILGINPVQEGDDGEHYDFQQAVKVFQQCSYSFRNMQLFEICEGCKKVLEDLFEKRAKKLNKLNKKIQEIPLPTEEETGKE